MMFEPVGLARQPVKSTADRSLQPFGPIGREERQQRRLDDLGLGDALPRCIIGQSTGQLGGQTECVFDAHGGSFVSELDAVAGIKTGLACEALYPALYRGVVVGRLRVRSEEHTSELQSLMRISYAVFCLKKK